MKNLLAAKYNRLQLKMYKNRTANQAHKVKIDCVGRQSN